MIPQTPSTTVPPDSSAQNLLKLGAPFRDFPRTSILDLQRHRGLDGSPVPFSEWLTKRLQIGQPFVIQDFDKLDTWDKDEFGIEKLIDLSTKKSRRGPFARQTFSAIYIKHEKLTCIFRYSHT
jgi:hypothetical protein